MTDTPASTIATRLGGRYRVLREIARGGMATVYRAVDEVLEREVAVKVLHEHLASDEVFLDRFLREARAAAALSHPHVVSVFDWGQDVDGDRVEAYLVMELVDGPSLRDVLRDRGALDPDEVSAVLAPAADGIAAAHARGLVHRDVKPENILLSAEGAVKVTDFGLARAAAASTQTFGPGAIVGSPHYLAPEAVREERLDARADVYALGIVAYECLVGEPPFSSDTALGTAMRHTAEQVPLPSDAPDVPEDLDDVVARATEPDPDHRFTDAAGFASAIRTAAPPGAVPILDGRRDTEIIPNANVDTVVPQLDSNERRSDRVPRRKRVRWGRRVLLPLLILAAVAGGLYLAWSELIAPVTDVPDVLGRPEAQAVEMLREQGFEPRTADEQAFSLEVPAGHVVSQDPSGDGQARVGSTVTIKLSAGPRSVDGGVPEVTGQPADEAAATLESHELEVTRAEEHHEEIAAGNVIRTDPPAGTEIKQGTSVALVVSAGPAPIEVPQVVGAAEAAAIEDLSALGLNPEVVAREFSEDVAAGVVMGQTPAPGEILYRGDTVQLTVSEGPPPFPMPDVEGRSREEALQILQSKGLEVVVREQGRLFGFVGPSDTVAKQEPEPGTTVRAGDTATIYVWK
ncbi:MAG: PASTA domain-containing protein [Actinobacteria bacterium]|nr:PASTA domain-containing protein [Actinomycetota bacterium]